MNPWHMHMAGLALGLVAPAHSLATDLVVTNTSSTDTLFVAAIVLHGSNADHQPEHTVADGFWQVAPNTEITLLEGLQRVHEVWLRVARRTDRGTSEVLPVSTQRLILKREQCARETNFVCRSPVLMAPYSRTLAVSFDNGSGPSHLQTAVENGYSYTFFKTDLSGEGTLTFEWN